MSCSEVLVEALEVVVPVIPPTTTTEGEDEEPTVESEVIVGSLVGGVPYTKQLNLFDLRDLLAEDTSRDEHWRYQSLHRAIQQFQEWKIFPREGEYRCPKGHKVKMFRDSRMKDLHKWKCRVMMPRTDPDKRAPQCNYSCSIRKNTFLYRSQLSLLEVASFTNLWVDNVPTKVIVKQVRITHATAVEWGQFHLEVLFEGMLIKGSKVGGLAKTVELQESKFGERKSHHQGISGEPPANGQWVIGGIERDTGKCFFESIEDRSKESLLAVVKQWVLPGSSIVCDLWKSYGCLDDPDFLKEMSQYSIVPKDLANGAHTNSIKSTYRQAESILPTSGHSQFLAGYLAKYMFMRSCRTRQVDPMLEFFRVAGECYNPLREAVEVDVEFNMAANFINQFIATNLQ